MEASCTFHQILTTEVWIGMIIITCILQIRQFNWEMISNLIKDTQIINRRPSWERDETTPIIYSVLSSRYSNCPFLSCGTASLFNGLASESSIPIACGYMDKVPLQGVNLETSKELTFLGSIQGSKAFKLFSPMNNYPSPPRHCFWRRFGCPQDFPSSLSSILSQAILIVLNLAKFYPHKYILFIQIRHISNILCRKLFIPSGCIFRWKVKSLQSPALPFPILCICISMFRK